MSTKELTEREGQAIYNFHKEGITNATLARHFGCSTAQVNEVILHRPWLQSRKSKSDAIELTWIQSDHTDPLELVKLFYPEYLPDGVSPEMSAKEKQREGYVQDWEAHYEKHYGYADGSVRFQMDTLFQEVIA